MAVRAQASKMNLLRVLSSVSPDLAMVVRSGWTSERECV